MHFFKNFDWSFKSILKVLGVILLGLAGISLAIMLVGFALDTVLDRDRDYDTSYPQEARDSYGEADYSKAGMGQSPAIYPPLPGPTPPAGEELEAFEVKEYQGQIETRNLERDCGVIADLKSREDVIFENSDQNQENCYFRFKVKKENAEEIVALVEDMDPEYFNVNIQTIKGTVDYYENELAILKKNLEETEAALQSALNDYDEVSALATRQGDTETLANIVSSKLSLIQQLSDKRLELQNTIERYEQNEVDQLDRLDYTFFNLTIQKDVILDWHRLGQSWEYQLKELVHHFNGMLQGLTVILLEILIRVFQGAVYFFLALFVLKGLWMGTKRIWRIGGKK